jgi:RHS repeat-associated protein
VRDASHTLATYRYNHRGQRIRKDVGGSHSAYLYENGKLSAKLDAQGKLTRQYLYLADQPIALLDSAASQQLRTTNNSALGQLINDFNAVYAALIGRGASIHYLHNNHLGATEIVTDDAAQPVWHADYLPFGKVLLTTDTNQTSATQTSISKRNAANFKLNLRLPGQYEDDETGLYYNDHRYYDPERGQYLTPDPLGLRGGINSYAYVSGNPMKYVDPSGLILFAFDGTGNSENPPPSDSISNVLKFYQAYDQQANGKAFYITGIGTTNQDMPYRGSQLTGDGFDQRINLGFKFLDTFMTNDAGTDTLNIDVVGFSRGAAEARVWINKLAGKLKNGSYTANGKTRCVDLRFEGLWDTVPHLGALNENEAKYDFTIPSAMKFAAQANALNEYRGGGANFNFRSILSSASQTSTSTRIEKGFLGSHSDIGGGFGTGDLSNVALMWMIGQAEGQGIKIDYDPISKKGWDAIQNPVLHDKSANLMTANGGPGPSTEDRTVIYGNGTSVKERQATSGTMTYADSVPFISYKANPLTSDRIAGTVDIQAYLQWLNDHEYKINIPAK